MKPILSAALCLFLMAILPFTLTFAQRQQGDVILNVDYESGTLNSGIEDIGATHAPAPDAASMVSPGATGQYAIAHKVIGDDTRYFSDGHTRSESDAVNFILGRYYPGDIRRYEFSVFLKDWVPFNGVDTSETNIFQLKMSNENPVPLQIRTQRNALLFRYGNLTQNTSTTQTDQDSTNDLARITVYTAIQDIRPYVNQWIHFRVDVLWATTATGYIKTYIKSPDQSDYVLADEKLNRVTFTGQPGVSAAYIKWGLYIAPKDVTRIAYHDDIRIINLNEPPTEVGLIWGNAIPDNNPAYLDGPYTKSFSILNRSYYGSTNVYMHPYVNYSASNNIVYKDATNPAPDPSDNVAGTPRSDFSRTTLSPSGGTGTTAGPSGRYLLEGWDASPAGSPTLINLNKYYEFQMEPMQGYHFDFSEVKFNVIRGGGAHPNTFSLRSSVDNFVADISTPITISGTTTPTQIVFNASSLNHISSPITFRLYAYGATGSGKMLVGLNDLEFLGQALPGSNIGTTTPTTPTNGVSNLSARIVNNTIQVGWLASAESNNGYAEVQFSKDGEHFTTAKKVDSQNSNKEQIYSVDISVAEAASLLAISFLLGFIQIKQPRKLRRVIPFFLMLVLATAAITCSQKANVITTDDKLYVRIKQVNTAGAVTYSSIAKVSKQ